MKVLFILFFSSAITCISQSTTIWDVIIKKDFDTTRGRIDSVPLVNNLKQGTFKSYIFNKKTGITLLETTIEYQANKAISSASYQYGLDGTVSSYVHEMDSNGKWTIAKEYNGSMLKSETFVLPNGKSISRYYHANGKLASEGRYKSYLSKHKARCNQPIYETKQIGIWKYYNYKGKRIYLFGKWRYYK
jgi:dolichyl-phosphate-mannose--protein O-mannosyl transferase